MITELQFHADAPTDAELNELALALHTETRLLLDLTEAMQRQRQGVATDDLAMVDDSVFAANRIVRTLGEARRRRRMLVESIWHEEIPLQDWKRAYARFMNTTLRDAVGRLQGAADALAREIAINRTVLQDAIAAGEGMIRAVAGAAPVPATYAPAGQPAPAQSGVLVNRKV